MMKVLQYPFDSSEILKKKKSIKRELLADGSTRFTRKIAVLGGSTTSDIVKIMELFLLDQGIEPKFYVCEYAMFEQEALFPSEEFASFAPDVILIHTSNRNIRNWPEISDSMEAVNAKLETEIGRFTAIWKALKDRFSCPIIQNNFDPPFYRILGNRDGVDYRGRLSFVNRLNEAFASYAMENDGFYINDLNYLASDYGIRNWADPSYWNMYKYCMCFDAIPYYAFSASNIIKALFGRNKKALALDLDNTLWGGVIGDDGPQGIQIGQENGVAQSYYEFQQYISQLRDLGILLNVCSKNDKENALEGIEHPEGALKKDDFVIIRANWDSKDRNIQEIASELNILPDSIVFVDDNPAEREIVSVQIPGVCTPVMDSVENYIINIDRSGFFENTAISSDDLGRNQMYRENILRQQTQATFADYGDYLNSLEMKAEIQDFIPLYLERIVQLTNKSNQFNLTTRRYSDVEMDEVRQSDEYIRLYGKLYDKFGDNGVVSVVIGRKGRYHAPHRPVADELSRAEAGYGAGDDGCPG